MNKRPPTQLVIRRPRRLPSISSAIAGLAIAGMTLAACSSAAGAVKPPTAQHSADFAKNHRVPADARAVAPAIVDETSDSLRQEHLGIDPSAARTPVAAASGASRKGQLRRTAPKAASTSTTIVNETADSLRLEHVGIAQQAAVVAPQAIASTFVNETADSLRKEHLIAGR